MVLQLYGLNTLVLKVENLHVYSTQGRGGGVHDLRMDGGLPSVFQTVTLL